VKAAGRNPYQYGVRDVDVAQSGKDSQPISERKEPVPDDYKFSRVLLLAVDAWRYGPRDNRQQFDLQRHLVEALSVAAARSGLDRSGWRIQDAGAGLLAWPLLLSVHVRSPELTEPIADLLRQLLRREGDQVAKQFLGRWIRQSEHDAELLAVLTGFLRHIIRNDGDEFRLIHLLDRLSRDWAEPLYMDVASRLREAIPLPPPQGAVPSLGGQGVCARERQAGRLRPGQAADDR